MPTKAKSTAAKVKSPIKPKAASVKAAVKPSPAKKLASATKPKTPAKNVPAAAPTSSKPPIAATTRSTKQSQLIDLLRSNSGGTVEEMMKLTGWQPHTVRGTLSGALRKRLGLTIQSVVTQGNRVYRIVTPA